MTCLHLRAWSRANSLVPADGDKVKEAFQVRLADPKRLPIPLGREVPFAPLRGPWSPFAGAGLVDPWEPFFFSGGPFFAPGSTFCRARSNASRSYSPAISTSGNRPGIVRAALSAFGIPVPVTEHRILPESSSPLENGKTWLVSARYEPRALSRRRMAS